MNRKQLRLFYERKWNRGLFRGTPFSVNPVLEPYDVKERYGEYKYTPEGIVEAEGTVTDASESIFVPARYAVTDVRVKSGQGVKEILEVVSFDRDYGDIAFEGERISVRGKLERVERLKGGDTYFRIVVGSIECGGEDYIKVDV
jgi:predicted nucleotidyltransferase